MGSSWLKEAIISSDVVLFVSNPDADVVNVPQAASIGKRIAVGTTGFTPNQYQRISDALRKSQAPSMVVANFSVGANILFHITRLISSFNELYDYSIIEHHHKLKSDAPSGTAKTMARLLNKDGAFPVTVSDRTTRPKRLKGEVEVVSLRGGGTPSLHQLILAGEHDMIRIEHLAFSRAAAALGALLACKWLASKNEPRLYTMDDVLSLN